MGDLVVFEDGGYRFIKAVFQYSSGVAALPGFSIERAVLARPLPLEDGFAVVEAHLRAIGRPCAAFAACELRSPEPFTEQGFRNFNKQYVTTLERWGIYKEGVNPVARTNVCPVYERPSQPSLYAFSYTVRTHGSKQGGFIIAGGAEMHEGQGPMQESVVRYREVSATALREKVRFVAASMQERLNVLGFSWRDALSTQAYTVHDIGPLISQELAGSGAMGRGLNWHFARPPIVDLEFEMDVRGACSEIVL